MTSSSSSRPKSSVSLRTGTFGRCPFTFWSSRSRVAHHSDSSPSKSRSRTSEEANRSAGSLARRFPISSERKAEISEFRSAAAGGIVSRWARITAAAWSLRYGLSPVPSS
jgi:hypothetical protein